MFLKQRNGMRAVGKLATLIMIFVAPELFCELAFVKLTEHKDAAPDINLFEIIPPVPEFGREQKTLLVDLEVRTYTLIGYNFDAWYQICLAVLNLKI